MKINNIDHLNDFEKSYFEEIKKLIDKGDLSLVNDLFADDYKFTLCTPSEFLNNPLYTGDFGYQMYPKLQEDFSRLFTTYGIMEVILAGSQRWGKNYFAEACCIKMMYDIIALKKPQEFFKISTSTDIYIAVFSINATKAKSEFFDGVKRVLDNSNFFNQYRVKKELESKVIFNIGDNEPARGKLVFVSGNSTELSAFGQNTIAGFLDEANFLPDIKNSKRSRGHGQQDNQYNAALTLYNSVLRRMKNTYGTNYGTLPGKFFIISSQKHEKDFVNTRIEQVKKNKDKSVFILRYASWDTNPKFKDSPKFFVGVNHKKNRSSNILTLEDSLEDYERVIEIPNIFKTEFETDFFGAMCDLAGETFFSTGKFINSLKVPLIFNKILKPFVNRNKIDFSVADVVFDKNKIININKPRFAHIDMAESGDNLGLGCGYLYGSKSITKQENGELITIELPIVAIDFLLTVVPPKYGKIDIDKIYELFLRLKNLGLSFNTVAYDRFQTTYLMQRLEKVGINTKYRSQDRLPCSDYSDLQHSIHQERLYSIDNDLLDIELKGLETINGKVEHPTDGSKDLADCVSSVCGQVHEYFIKNNYSGQLIEQDIKPVINNNFNIGSFDDFDAW